MLRGGCVPQNTPRKASFYPIGSLRYNETTEGGKSLSKQKRKKRNQRLQREKRRKNRVGKVIQHFTECSMGLMDDGLIPAGSWSYDKDGMHVEMRCSRCQLRLTRHNESGEFTVKNVGRFRWDATVLDLLAL